MIVGVILNCGIVERNFFCLAKSLRLISRPHFALLVPCISGLTLGMNSYSVRNFEPDGTIYVPYKKAGDVCPLFFKKKVLVLSLEIW